MATFFWILTYCQLFTLRDFGLPKIFGVVKTWLGHDLWTPHRRADQKNQSPKFRNFGHFGSFPCSGQANSIKFSVRAMVFCRNFYREAVVAEGSKMEFLGIASPSLLMTCTCLYCCRRARVWLSSLIWLGLAIQFPGCLKLPEAAWRTTADACGGCPALYRPWYRCLVLSQTRCQPWVMMEAWQNGKSWVLAPGVA